jgi:FMN reductase
MNNPLHVTAVVGTMHAPSKTTALVELILKSLGSRTPIESHIIETHTLASNLGPALQRDLAGEQVEQALHAVENADMLIAATPVFRGTFTGLFKHFFDLIDQYALANKPVILAATGGSERHAMVIDQELRPLFGFFQTWTAPMGIYLSSGDFDGTTVLNPEVYERIEVAVADVVPVALALATAHDSMAGDPSALNGGGWATSTTMHG